MDVIEKSKQQFTQAIKPRKRYFDRLESFIDTRQIVVVQGQRRVGKSRIILGYLQKLQVKPDKIFFFNKELDYLDTIPDAKALGEVYDAYEKSFGVPEYIVIDEIQDIQNREKFIRAKFAEGKQKIIISGSNSQLLSWELATYLTGRYLSFHVFPLDYLEFLAFTGKTDSPAVLMDFFHRCGMPEIALLEQDDQKLEYLNDLLNTIFFKDVVRRFTIKDVDFLRNVIRYLADSVGNQVSLRNIQNASKNYGWGEPSTNKLGHYVEILQAPYLIHKVERFDVQGKRILEHNQKYYFNDIGLRNSLKIKMDEDRGKLLENIVFLHLKKLGYKVFVGALGTKEIDFVAQRGQNTHYFQVAYQVADEKVKEREFGNLLDIKDGFPKYVVSVDTLPMDFKGIKHWNIQQFLREFTG